MYAFSIIRRAESPIFVEANHYRRLTFVQGLETKYLRHSTDWVTWAAFDIYVDFRPGKRARWRPWIYAFADPVCHRLEALDHPPTNDAFGYAISEGRLLVRENWWDLLAKRFPNTDITAL